MKFKSIYELDNSLLRRKFLEKSIRIKTESQIIEMEQLKEKVEIQINDGLSETCSTDEESCKSSRLQDITAEKLIAINRKEEEQKIVNAKISLMHKRWDGELESNYSKGDQILIDDEIVGEYSELVMKQAAEEEERIRKSIEEGLALLRRTYEALGQFDDHMLQVLKREE